MRQFSDTFAMKHAQTLAAGYLLLPQLSPSAHAFDVGIAVPLTPLDVTGPAEGGSDYIYGFDSAGGPLPH